jgi:MFS transporter, DHA1 family, inner membrane transport protein
MELSWAGGLLIGVPVMGLVTWATSWHVAYVVAAVAVIALAGLVAKLLEPGVHRDAGPLAPEQATRSPLPWRRIAPQMSSNLFLMLAAQAAFVTFGSWLEDEFGFNAAGLAAVAFALGAGELIASSSSVRFTDAWGKRRSMIYGAALMVPSGLLLALAHGHVALGLVWLAVYILGFEFAIISGLPLSSNLIPGRPSTGIGIVMVAGTAGRAGMSVPAARLYEHHGLIAPMLLGSGCALLCVGVAQFVYDPGRTTRADV